MHRLIVEARPVAETVSGVPWFRCETDRGEPVEALRVPDSANVYVTIAGERFLVDLGKLIEDLATARRDAPDPLEESS